MTRTGSASHTHDLTAVDAALASIQEQLTVGAGMTAVVAYVITAKGRIHKAAIVGDQVLTDERCNLDEAGDRTIAFDLPESASDETCCDLCLPGSWTA